MDIQNLIIIIVILKHIQLEKFQKIEYELRDKKELLKNKYYDENKFKKYNDKLPKLEKNMKKIMKNYNKIRKYLKNDMSQK